MASPDWIELVAAALSKSSGHPVVVLTDLRRTVGPHTVVLSDQGVHVGGGLADTNGDSISLLICPNPSFRNGSSGWYERWHLRSGRRSPLDAYDGGLRRLLTPFIQ